MSKKVGFTCSTFDLLHAGHILMLEEAKTQCDWLIVGLQIDPTVDRTFKNKPIQSVFERYVQLRGCKYVDEIIPYATEDELYQLLTSHKIHVRIIGEEYQNRDFTGKNLDIPIYYNSRKHKFSTTNLRERVENEYNKKMSAIQKFPYEMRSEFSTIKIPEINLDDFNKSNIFEGDQKSVHTYNFSQK